MAVRLHARPTTSGLVVDVSARPLGSRLEFCRMALADRPSHSWRHKWADRTPPTAAEQLVSPALPYFLDQRGRVAETSRGNRFVLGADGIWWTSPSGDHQLPGVTRRALLDGLSDRDVPYEIAPIGPEELGAARSVAWTSSLSGVVAVNAIDGRPLEVDGSPAAWTGGLGIG